MGVAAMQERVAHLRLVAVLEQSALALVRFVVMQGMTSGRWLMGWSRVSRSAGIRAIFRCATLPITTIRALAETRSSGALIQVCDLPQRSNIADIFHINFNFLSNVLTPIP